MSRSAGLLLLGDGAGAQRGVPGARQRAVAATMWRVRALSADGRPCPMSSTNRSADHQAARQGISDYYVTPPGVVLEFLQAAQHRLPLEGRILDPCAGGDATHPMSYPTALEAFGVPSTQILTCDIRPDSRADRTGVDFLSLQRGDLPELGLIITNPPFNQAIEMIAHAREQWRHSALCLLLRLNFYGGTGRKAKLFAQVGVPHYAFVHRRRISFMEGRGTDSIEYMHAIWRPESITAPVNQTTLLEVI